MNNFTQQTNLVSHLISLPILGTTYRNHNNSAEAGFLLVRIGPGVRRLSSLAHAGPGSSHVEGCLCTRRGSCGLDLTEIAVHWFWNGHLPHTIEVEVWKLVPSMVCFWDGLASLSRC